MCYLCHIKFLEEDLVTYLSKKCQISQYFSGFCFLMHMLHDYVNRNELITKHTDEKVYLQNQLVIIDSI